MLEKVVPFHFQKNIEILEDLVHLYPGLEYFISIGPYAIFYRDCSEYSGAYLRDERKINESHVCKHYEQMLDLIEATGKKYVVFETIPSLLEVRAALEAIKGHKEMKCFLTVYAAVSFYLVALNPIKICMFKVKYFQDEERTGAGDGIEDIVSLINQYDQIIAFGVNCCDPRICVPVSQRLSKLLKPGISIIIKPNNGKHYNSDTKEQV